MKERDQHERSHSFDLRPASREEAGLFYPGEERDEALGTVGHLRLDFGPGGKSFWSTWWPHNGDRLNTSEFKEALQSFVDALREEGPLKDLSSMGRYCRQHGGAITEDGRSYGYIGETEHYRFCLRCAPRPGDYQGYLYVYDLRQQELARQAKLVGRVTYASGEEAPRRACSCGLTEAGKQALRDAADPRRPHTYAWSVLTDCGAPEEQIHRDLTLEEAVQLYRDSGRPEKRLGVTKDGIATVDLVRCLDGEQQFFEDFRKLESFRNDPVVFEAVETLRLELEQLRPQENMMMGEM